MEVKFGKPLVHIFQGFQRVQYSEVLVFLLNQIFEHLLLEILVDICDPQLQIATAFSSYLHSSYV